MSRRALIAKRKQQQRIRSMISIATLIFSILIVFSIFGLDTNARSTSDMLEYKYFMNYELQRGDSLWSVASANYDDHYDSVEDYIEEICIINSVSCDTELIAGSSLIIPYYSYEFKY